MDQVLDVLRQNVFLFTILGGVVTVLGFLFKIYQGNHDKQVRFLNSRIHGLEQDLKAAKEAGDPVILKDQNSQLFHENGQLQNHLGIAAADQNKLQEQCNELKAAVTSAASTIQIEREASRLKIDGLNDELEGQKEQLVKQEQVESRREHLVKQALKLEGRIWQRKVLCSAPRFRPLHERHVAIISILNLKGGVGKTTITAHLGAALSSRGYRVLLVDLDLQGSLSGLFVNETILKERSDKGQLLQHYLTNAANRRKANLLEYCVPMLDGNSAIVPATDTMGYAEMSLTMRWLLRLGKKDNRFLLRRGLHQKRVTSRYDVVLLDCPPILNACCLNALAASDYVLIPAVPSRSAVARVPLSLRRLDVLRPIINPNLQVIGALLNRTRGSQFSQWEKDLWGTTLTECQNVWKLPVYSFQTPIRQTNEVRDNENEFHPPAPGSELQVVFSKIVDELEARLPNDCRRVPIPLD